MNCVKHNHLKASGMCIHCRKPGCDDCLIEISGKYHCRECLSHLNQKEGDYVLLQNRENQTYSDSAEQVSEKKSIWSKLLWTLMFIYLPLVGIFIWDKGPFGSKGNEVYRLACTIWTIILILSFISVI